MKYWKKFFSSKNWIYSLMFCFYFFIFFKSGVPKISFKTFLKIYGNLKIKMQNMLFPNVAYAWSILPLHHIFSNFRSCSTILHKKIDKIFSCFSYATEPLILQAVFGIILRIERITHSTKYVFQKDKKKRCKRTEILICKSCQQI